MATPTLANDDPPQAEYYTLLTFVDVVYSAVLSYGLYLFSDQLSPAFEGKSAKLISLGLLAFITLYLVGDYVDARLYTATFGYRRLSRFCIDLGIAFAFFIAYVGAWKTSAYALPLLAFVSVMGAIWIICTNSEYQHNPPLKFHRLLISSHFGLAVVLLWIFREVIEQKIPLKQLGSVQLRHLWLAYLVLGIAYSVIEWKYKIPSMEADLFPTFPIGRIVRALLKFANSMVTP